MTTYEVYTKTASSTLNYDDGIDVYFIDASSGNIVITFPQINYDGMRWRFKRIDSSGNSVSFGAYSGDSVGSPSSLTAGQSIQYVSLISSHTWYAFYL